MSLTSFKPISNEQALSRTEAVVKALADHLANLSGSSTARISGGACFARDDLIVCVGGEGGDLSAAASTRDWSAVILLWKADRPASSRFNVVVHENGRTEYFPSMRLLIDDKDRAQFMPANRNGSSVMIGRSAPVPGAGPEIFCENGWADAEQRALDVLFAHEDNQPSSPVDTERDLAGPGLRTFRNIARFWELTTDEEMKLLGPQATDIAETERSSEPVGVSKNTLLRISAVFGIYAALESLLPGRSRRWIRHPNRAELFNGRAPLEMMMSDSLDDLLRVRRYLDAQFA
ncbi:MbcA/ParS/Xre antitoxin family protein [Sphingomonas sp. AX6]|uniref:MbcA/ParS/Xre antitoxin family protein n=1 Tax=Sphingomonas sp. AX6 TaxID=2653171 RepID=UPI0012F27484|nr:MbcA/ParS/Xre antitoxin family protein [Sphingomonas sp. AX6]VXC98090.1 hypothetical protein SPHINGOAX6_70753 [Sphingomonas sp. AX6]